MSTGVRFAFFLIGHAAGQLALSSTAPGHSDGPRSTRRQQTWGIVCWLLLLGTGINCHAVSMPERLGADVRAWPAPDDRFASDLLLADRIADPWLAALTRSAAAAPIPVLLGGHSLVGPGIRLALGPGR